MRQVMEKLEVKSLNSPDEVRTFEKGKVEIVTLGDRVVGRAVFEPGWKWSTCLGPIAKTKSCEAAHFGYQISGLMKVLLDDGREITLKPGDVINIPPGHDAWVEGSKPVVAIDFQGLKDYAKQK